ncbi:MAG: hypothetical protein EPN85_03755 [Bacteroidetes bacterium]|nr:MAG: hypothetical protein EPN85_03755 [Bacteroidota bacterium]
MLNKKLIAISGAIFLAGGLLVLIKSHEILSVTERFLSRTLNDKFWSTGLQYAGTSLILCASTTFLFFFFYKKHQKSTLLGSAALWALSFICFVLLNTVNIPYHDDYYFLEFLNAYTEKKDLSKIFHQGNESRFIFLNSISLLLYYMGVFNFKTLVMIALICLLGSSLILFYSSKLEIKNKPFMVLLLAILLFQFQYYDAVVWVSGALYNSCTLFFAMTSIFFLSPDRKNGLLPAIASSLLSVSCCGAGFISLVIGSAILIMNRKIRESIFWTAISVSVLILYLTNYSFGGSHYGNAGGTQYLMDKVFSCLLFSPVFLGGSVQFLYQIYAPFILGLFVWFTFFFSTWKKYYLKNPVIYYSLLFTLLISFAPPFFRNNLPACEGINIRYGIYSIFSLACTVMIWSEMIRRKKVRILFVYLFPVGIVFHLLTGIFFYPEVVLRVEKGKTMARNFKRINSVILPAPYKQGPSNAVFLFNVCREKNIYHLPEE